MEHLNRSLCCFTRIGWIIRVINNVKHLNKNDVLTLTNVNIRIPLNIRINVSIAHTYRYKYRYHIYIYMPVNKCIYIYIICDIHICSFFYRFLLIDQIRLFFLPRSISCPEKLAPFRLLVDLATRTRKSWKGRDSTRNKHVATVKKCLFLILFT